MFDIAFIGGGPSAMFATLYLIEHGYEGKILILEQGKSLKNRKRDELISGVFGAGTFSDSKLVAALDVGGIIPGLTQKDLDDYGYWVLQNLNLFNPNTLNHPENRLNWSESKDFNTYPTNLSFNKHKTLHVGTDYGYKIYFEMERFIASNPHVALYTEVEVKDINQKEIGYEIVCNFNSNYSHVNLGNRIIFTSKKIVVATGQKSDLPEKIINKFNIPFENRALQLGIRVEDEINPQYEKIIAANYDFKFVENFDYNGVKIKVRTFCCNSGNAHTCAEHVNEGFICFNGHAYKEPDPSNHTVNYGIMCEALGLENYKTKQDQIKLMKKVNNYPTWKEDNFDNSGKVVPKRKLLDGVNFLQDAGYPSEIIEAMNRFINDLGLLVDLSKAHFLYPEIKLSGSTPKIDYNTFETPQKGLYMIGDCCVSRGIFKGICTSIIFAKNQLLGE